MAITCAANSGTYTIPRSVAATFSSTRSRSGSTRYHRNATIVTAASPKLSATVPRHAVPITRTSAPANPTVCAGFSPRCTASTRYSSASAMSTATVTRAVNATMFQNSAPIRIPPSATPVTIATGRLRPRGVSAISPDGIGSSRGADCIPVADLQELLFLALQHVVDLGHEFVRELLQTLLRPVALILGSLAVLDRTVDLLLG